MNRVEQETVIHFSPGSLPRMDLIVRKPEDLVTCGITVHPNFVKKNWGSEGVEAYEKAARLNDK